MYQVTDLIEESCLAASRGEARTALDRAKEVLAQGYLYKKKRGPPGQHTWVTRWFVLRADDCLYSFKSENVRNNGERA